MESDEGERWKARAVAALGSPERLFPHGVREWRGHVEFERLAQLEDRLLQLEALVEQQDALIKGLYRRTPGETKGGRDR